MKPLLTALLASSTMLLPLSADYAKIIPSPLESVKSAGSFPLQSQVSVVAPKSLENEVKQLQQLLRPATGFPLQHTQTSTKSPQIHLELDTSLSSTLGAEGYTLSVTTDKLTIKGASPAGVFYGIQSLRQLLPAEIASSEKISNVKWEIPAGTITDSPRFAWRAFMLDEARHFKGEKEVKKLLDQMANLKMNVFHWHLTDDQGWRIEIKKYPKLTEIGSKRKDSEIITWSSGKSAGKPHSGFYTQEQIKAIVQYAAERHITIVPEIGMPGHAVAAIAAYPELGTKKEKIEVWSKFGKAYHTYDPSADSTYKILGEVLDEVFELFPSRIVHIGGDEVRFDHWKESDSVKALMEREGLKTMADVQLYFTNRMAEIVQSKGRNIMGWNEIVGDDLHGFLSDGQTASAAKLDKDTVVHFWKGSADLAKKAIKNGHTIVNSWHSFTYLDYGYGSISLKKAYQFDPIIKGLTPAEEKRIIGFGCQMWGEWIPTVKEMENKVYPRLAAYSEVGWTPQSNKDFEAFQQSMQKQLKRWDIQGIHYAKGQTNSVTASDFFNYQLLGKWSSKDLATGYKDMDFMFNHAISKAGTYEVALIYAKGAHALNIRSVSLLKNNTVISTDTHEGFSGNQLRDITYKVELPKYDANANYTLRFNVKGSGGTDSYGDVKFKLTE